MEKRAPGCGAVDIASGRVTRGGTFLNFGSWGDTTALYTSFSISSSEETEETRKSAVWTGVRLEGGSFAGTYPASRRQGTGWDWKVLGGHGDEVIGSVSVLRTSGNPTCVAHDVFSKDELWHESPLILLDSEFGTSSTLES